MTKLEFVRLLLYLNTNTQSTPTAIYTLEKIVPSVKTFISKKEENITTAITLVVQIHLRLGLQKERLQPAFSGRNSKKLFSKKLYCNLGECVLCWENCHSVEYSSIQFMFVDFTREGISAYRLEASIYLLVRTLGRYCPKGLVRVSISFKNVSYLIIGIIMV